MQGAGIDPSAEWGTPRWRRRRPSKQARTYPLKWVLVAFAAVALVLIGGPYFYFNVIEGKAPGKLSLPPAKGVGSGPVVPGPASGTWTISSGSIAGYRVNEVLFGQTHTAVGRTAKVSGGMIISGTEVTAADFTVDLKAVKSDQGARDAQFNGFIMKTYDYPDATFKLTEPIQLGSIPAVGQQIHAPATGNLHMRGVTQPISFTVAAERVGNGIDLNAEIPIVFARWHIPNPSFAVAQVGSSGTLEVLLHLVADGKATAAG